MWPSAPARKEPIGASTIRLRSSRFPICPGASRWRYSAALMRLLRGPSGVVAEEVPAREERGAADTGGGEARRGEALAPRPGAAPEGERAQERRSGQADGREQEQRGGHPGDPVVEGRIPGRREPDRELDDVARERAEPERGREGGEE